MSEGHDIAIVGMAGRFPGAGSIDEFWRNLSAGVESVQEASEEELRAVGVPDAALADPRYVRAVASAPHVEDFDAAFFGFTPREAASADPQIRMFLETAHAALEHAGHNPHGIRETVAVYGSAGTNRYVDMHLGNRGDVSSTSSMAVASLNNTDYVASTVAYKLDLRGAAITLSTACSSSLVALHLACQALRNGECDLALAGGVDVEYPVRHGYQWDDGGPVSRVGHVRPFDADADGTVFGTGAGAVVVKRLSDALADGDTVHAVIRGTAVNNDGADKAGFTAPAVSGQAAMLTEALAMAGVTPAEISYVEAHATGTPLGDPIEIAALSKAYRRLSDGELPPGSCPIGSVKGNLGHLGHAAGIASLIKVVLALGHGQIPPTANFSRPNERLQLEGTPFFVNDTLLPGRAARVGAADRRGQLVRRIGRDQRTSCGRARPQLPEPAGPRRRRSMSGRGKSEGPPPTPTAPAVEHSTPVRPRYGRSSPPCRRVAGRTRDRRSVVARPPRRRWRRAGRGDVTPGAAGAAAEIAFLFPAQGAAARMAAGLYGTEPVFTDALDRCLEAFTRPRSRRPRPVAVGHRRGADRHRPRPAAAVLGRVRPGPAVDQLGGAAHRRLRAQRRGDRGRRRGRRVRPGRRRPPGRRRVRATVAAPPGGMLAVAASVEDLEGGCRPGCRSPSSTARRRPCCPAPPTTSPRRPRPGRAPVGCRPLATSRAFHSPLMAGAAAAFGAAVGDIRTAPPRLGFYSAAAAAS
jgi:acyl transferase domain-containing protein